MLHPADERRACHLEYYSQLPPARLLQIPTDALYAIVPHTEEAILILVHSYRFDVAPIGERGRM